MKRIEQGLLLQPWQDNIYVSLLHVWLLILHVGRGRWKEHWGSWTGSFQESHASGRSLCVSSAMAECVERFMSCSCWNRIYVNGVSQTPAKFSCPIDQGWHVGEGSGRSFVLTLVMPECCCQPRWCILSKSQQWAPSAYEPFPLHVSILPHALVFYKASGERECNRSPS